MCFVGGVSEFYSIVLRRGRIGVAAKRLLVRRSRSHDKIYCNGARQYIGITRGRLLCYFVILSPVQLPTYAYVY